MKNVIRLGKRLGLALLVVAMVFNITSCGDKTLEDMVNDNKEVKQQIESMAVGGLEAAIKDNQVIYTYTYQQTLDQKSVEAIKPEFEKLMKNTDAIYKTMIDQLENSTKLEDISVKIIYKNGDGNVIHEHEYK